MPKVMTYSATRNQVTIRICATFNMRNHMMNF